MKRVQHEPCDFCNGRLEPRAVTVDSRRGGRLVVIENVPARVCDRCGERYYAASTMRAMEAISRGRAGRRRVLRVPVARFEGVA
jgi:YgiT-type zinc finger domain-containing protein